MKLEQAVKAFAHTDVDGWDQSTGQWVPCVARGNILTFDRFITERSFGQKKRIFELGGSVPLPSNYEAIRDPTGTRWLIDFFNQDIAHNSVYNNIYLIQRASYDGTLIRKGEALAASGAPIAAADIVVATFPMDFDKVTSANSGEFDGVIYSGFVAKIPYSVAADTDHELRIGTTGYDILEVFETGGLKALRLNKRSASA